MGESNPRPSGILLLGGGDERLSTGRMMAIGLLVWGAYSALQVAINGVVMDETVVPAQIITNAVEYPAGHPHDLFYRSVYNLGHFLSAAMWAASPDGFVISAFRNWLFLLTAAFAPFAVTLAITRKPSWAHASVALVLLGASMRYSGVYPMWVFPNYYSNGHIGLHVVVIAAALLTAGLWRSGGVLVGLMPAIHATLSAALWPWAVVFLALALRKSSVGRHRAIQGFGIGVVACLALALLIAILPDSADGAAPYLTGLDGPFRDNFIALSDVHRQTLPWYSIPYLAHPIVFGAVGFLLLRGTTQAGSADGNHGDARRSALWLLFLGLGSWSIVYGARAIEWVMGGMPGTLETAMPWRFSNVSAVLLPALVVSAIAFSTRALAPSGRAAVNLLVLGLLIFAAVAALPSVELVSRDLVERNVLALMLGVLIGIGCAKASWLRGSVLALVATTAAFSVFWSTTKVAVYLAAVAGSTLAVVLVATRIGPKLLPLDMRRPWRGPAFALTVLTVALATIPDRSEDPVEPGRMRWDMISQADLELRDWLARNAQFDEPVLTPFYPRAELQSKTGQPVLLEPETLWIMTYVPDLAPVIGTMVYELYDVDYRDAAALTASCDGEVSPWCGVWADGWTARPRDRWIELSDKYGFRLVLSDADAPLDLPHVWERGHWRLHEIPEAASADF